MLWDAVVVGAGVQGLSAAYHLHRLGCRQIAIVDSRLPGHSDGSSHGHERITRSSYPHLRYVQMMQQVMAHEWPQIEAIVGEPLIAPVTGCLFGPADGAISNYASAVAEAGANVDSIDAERARKLFPHLNIADGDQALVDHTAGVIFSSKTLKALVSLCSRAGTHFMSNTMVRSVDFGRHPIRVYTADGNLDTRHVVITAGAWTRHLVPELESHLTVKRQTVVYLTADHDDVSLHSGFPTWIYLGHEDNDHFYGLPCVEGNRIKLARHRTSGPPDNPDYRPDIIDSALIAEVEEFAKQHLRSEFSFERAEHCLYTNTPTEDYILDTHPHNQRVAIGTGFSGHGFKLAPLCGRILAELALEGETSLDCFQSAREHFRLPALI